MQGLHHDRVLLCQRRPYVQNFNGERKKYHKYSSDSRGRRDIMMLNFNVDARLGTCETFPVYSMYILSDWNNPCSQKSQYRFQCHGRPTVSGDNIYFLLHVVATNTLTVRKCRSKKTRTLLSQGIGHIYPLPFITSSFDICVIARFLFILRQRSTILLLLYSAV